MKTVPVGGGGTQPAPCSARSRKAAICARVTGSFGQKLPPPQPAVTPLRKSFSMASWNMWLPGTSRKSANQPRGSVRVEASGLVTTTSWSAPGGSAGAVAVISVSLTTVEAVAGAPPKVTAAPAWKLSPRILTTLPPAEGPERG